MNPAFRPHQAMRHTHTSASASQPSAATIAKLLTDRSLRIPESEIPALSRHVRKISHLVRNESHASRKEVARLLESDDLAQRLFQDLAPGLRNRGQELQVRRPVNARRSFKARADRTVTVQLVFVPSQRAIVKRDGGERLVKRESDVRGPKKNAIHADVLGTFSAESLDELEAGLAALDLPVYGYNDRTRAVLASRNLREAPASPAILQLSRTQEEKRYELAIRWLDPEPDITPEIRETISRLVGPHGGAAR
ncbi:hypothetical protein [Curtobacterium sp. VKM Ac-1395]|uniref:hypothetical protein n=1 Tax=Curtobacterium sp. VKM Ac-1395 TaxID=2783815 RepID=UPI00188A7EB6|nr:hypothetical protein [Curtobacterium sp. VKM Ac-1395]MBF4592015.1 hypothetical protein [Curtobacterium sp. VKM Ac-1395]